MKLLKVYEYRVLNILVHQNMDSTLLLSKIIEILEEALDKDDMELCDPHIMDAIEISSRKIKDRNLLDSVVVAHHYVRDIWKNGSRDLPFFYSAQS